MDPIQRPTTMGMSTRSAYELDLRDVRGQMGARRALEIAAAGRHNLLMIGPPGCGKTMLAVRLPGLLPVADGDTECPFRAPHRIRNGDARWRRRAEPYSTTSRRGYAARIGTSHKVESTAREATWNSWANTCTSP